LSFRSPRVARALQLKGLQCTRLSSALRFHIINQLTIIGFIGRDAETKYLPNGTPVVKFTVATKKSWKDETDGWKEKTQWHSVVAFGEGFAKTAGRLVKGAHVFVQGELATCEYDRTITIRKDKETIEHAIPQLVVELRADSIRILDRRNSGADHLGIAASSTDQEVPE
jgi:single-strand DNA-binding protein